MEKSNSLKENNTDTDLPLSNSFGSYASTRAITPPSTDIVTTQPTTNLSNEIAAIQNLFIIERYEEELLKMKQLIELKYKNIFTISTFSNFVPALLKINKNTSVVMFNGDYFEKSSPTIIKFIKNRSSKTLIISSFEKVGVASILERFIKKITAIS